MKEFYKCPKCNSQREIEVEVKANGRNREHKIKKCMKCGYTPEAKQVLTHLK